MELTINTHKHGKISFWMDDRGGYIYLQYPDRPGQLGQQICTGGRFTGSTVSATPETFEKACRRWHKRRLDSLIEHDNYYE